MLPISVCIIAKNEEEYIEECLRRLSKYDWEIIVVDTGSTDRTVEIASTFTPHIYHFDWINDFSAARNYSISKASNDYILIVDCDEYLEESDHITDTIKNISQLLSPEQIGMIYHRSSLEESTDTSTNSKTLYTHEKLARVFNRKHTYYQGTIHEQLVSKNNIPLQFITLPLYFYHAGYSTLDIRLEKANRNISMLKHEIQSNKPDPYLYFQVGQTYFGISDYENAITYYELALSTKLNENELYVQTLVESYGYCLLNLKKYEDALKLEGVYSVFSKRADFVFLMGLIYMNNALFDKAVYEFKKATTINYFSVEGVNSYSAYYNIGVIYECMDQLEEAVIYYRKCGDYAPALKRLAHYSP